MAGDWGEAIGTDQAGFQTFQDLEAVYTYGNLIAYSRRAYSYAPSLASGDLRALPALPVFMKETEYEGETLSPPNWAPSSDRSPGRSWSPRAWRARSWAGPSSRAASTPARATISAAQAADGSLLLVYVPSTATTAQTFAVDLRSMQDYGRARWWNPTSGAVVTNASAAGTYTLRNTAAAQSFTTPGDNGTGSNDWVLVVDVQP